MRPDRGGYTGGRSTTAQWVDQTGTQAQNRTTPHRLSIANTSVDRVTLPRQLPEALPGLSEDVTLASNRDPFDSVKRALHQSGERFIKNAEELHPTWSLAKEHPLAPNLLAVSQAWHGGIDDEVAVGSS